LVREGRIKRTPDIAKKIVWMTDVESVLSRFEHSLNTLLNQGKMSIDRPEVNGVSDFKHWIKSTWEQAISEYIGFVKAYGFSFPNSPYLNPTTSLFVDIVFDETRLHFIIERVLLKNKDNSLPRVQVEVIDTGQSRRRDHTQHTLEVNGTAYDIMEWGQFLGEPTFHTLNNRPLFQLMYKFLMEDLGKHYGRK
jgi:hypothetical protein